MRTGNHRSGGPDGSCERGSCRAGGAGHRGALLPLRASRPCGSLWPCHRNPLLTLRPRRTRDARTRRSGGSLNSGGSSRALWACDGRPLKTLGPDRSCCSQRSGDARPGRTDDALNPLRSRHTRSRRSRDALGSDWPRGTLRACHCRSLRTLRTHGSGGTDRACHDRSGWTGRSLRATGPCRADWTRDDGSGRACRSSYGRPGGA